MKKAFAILLAIATASVAEAAQPSSTSTQAACQLRIESPIGNWIIQGYDPFASSSSTGSYDLVFVNTGEAQCSFFPRFATQGEPLGLAGTSGRRVLYSLLDLYGDYDATPIGGRTQRRTTQRAVVIAPHSQQLVRYVFKVATDALPADGEFTQSLLVEAEGTSGDVIAQRQLTMGINVLPSAMIGLAGAYRRINGQVDVDLGELSQGVVGVPLQLYVQSTRGYRLQIHSQNAGHLRLSGTNWEVPYQFIIDGHGIPLTSDGEYSANVKSGLRRDTLPIGFSIGNVDNRRAGVYSDVITVSVSLI